MRRFLLQLLYAAGAASSAGAQGDWLLIDRSLREQRIELMTISPGLATFIDADGRAVELPVASILALVQDRPMEDRPARDPRWIARQLEMFGPLPNAIAGEEEAEPFPQVLRLTDGQRWVGSLAGARGDSLRWSVLSGALDAPLERVAAVELTAPATGAAATWNGIDDRLALTNGDLIDGFVASVHDAVSIEGGGRTEQIPLGVVAAMLLANPPVPPSGTRIWTEDGSVLRVASISASARGRVALGMGSESPDQLYEVSREHLRAVLFDATAATSLSALLPAGVTPPEGLPLGVRVVGDSEAVFGEGRLTITGPAVVRWELGRSAVRFAATIDLPPANWAWGDCDVVVRAPLGGGAGDELFRESLSAASPRCTVNVPLGGATTLIIAVESARRGPVQDGVVLTRPIVLWR